MTKQVASSVMGHRKGSRAPWLGSGAGRHSLPGKVTLEPRGGREARFWGWHLWWPGDSGRLVQCGELMGAPELGSWTGELLPRLPLGRHGCGGTGKCHSR